MPSCIYEYTAKCQNMVQNITQANVKISPFCGA